jgi:hypothetical protein
MRLRLGLIEKFSSTKGEWGGGADPYCFPCPFFSYFPLVPVGQHTIRVGHTVHVVHTTAYDCDSTLTLLSIVNNTELGHTECCPSVFYLYFVISQSLRSMPRLQTLQLPRYRSLNHSRSRNPTEVLTRLPSRKLWITLSC